jgi:FixJ family two-component response regulator
MSNQQPIVYVVDDDPSVLRSIERLLRLHDFRTRSYQDPWRFLDELDVEAPGCVLLDLSLPGASGLEVQEQLAAAGAAQPIVFLTGRATVQSSVRAMKAGAFDFIEKPFDSAALLASVRRALERDEILREKRSRDLAISDRIASLTPRESEVLRHVIAGRLNKQIAARLGTAEKTVKVHRARVMHKMSVRSVAELTRIALVIGIQPEP